MSRPIALALVWLLLASAVTAAHGDGVPWLVLSAREAKPGEDVVLSGDDFEPGVLIVVELSARANVFPLGTTTTDDDGHFLVKLRIPNDLDEGNARLLATSAAGSIAEVFVWVGDSANGSPEHEAVADSAWTDQSVLVLGVLLGGALVALLYLFFRPGVRHRGHQLSAGQQRVPRVVPRRSKTRARPRRA